MGIRPVADFETLNYQIMNELNTSTEAPNTTETAIAYSTCYRLPFLSLFHADCMEIMKQYPDKYFDLAIVDPPYGIKIMKQWGAAKHDYRQFEVKQWDNEIPTAEYYQIFEFSGCNTQFVLVLTR